MLTFLKYITLLEINQSCYFISNIKNTQTLFQKMFGRF